MNEKFEMQSEHQHVWARVLDTFGGSFALHGVNQTIGRRDKTIVAEVFRAGPGNVSRGTLNACMLKPGDLVLVNLYHRSHELTVLGVNLSTFNWENIMAMIRIDEAKKAIQLTPLQGFIVTRTNEDRAQLVMMGHLAGKIINPSGDAQVTGGSSFDERGKRVEQIKVACEEVVHVGPGAVIDGLWQEPRCKPGDMVLYDTSTTPVSFTAGGQSFTLIHWRCVLGTFRTTDGKATSERSSDQSSPRLVRA